MTQTQLQTIEFKIEGMDCGHCVSTIEKAVRALPGVDAVKVSLADSSALVKLNPVKVSRDTIYEAVEHAGVDFRRELTLGFH